MRCERFSERTRSHQGSFGVPSRLVLALIQKYTSRKQSSHVSHLWNPKLSAKDAAFRSRDKHDVDASRVKSQRILNLGQSFETRINVSM